MTHGTRPVRPMGPHAALVECAPGESGRLVLAAARAGVRPGSAGVVEVVPAATTVLVECTDTGSLERAIAIVGSVAPETGGSTHTDPIEIAVRFDGDDLAEVAARVGRRVDQVVDAVTGADYEVAFCGFAPGFAYLAGLDPALHLPRRDAPRTRVPSGSFAIATEYAAVYPTTSPGGWHLLGSTDAVVWSLERDPPALLQPGTAVRIVREES